MPIKATYRLPDCNVVLVPRKFLKRKPWFKPIRGEPLFWVIRDKTIYLTLEQSSINKIVMLNLALATFVTINKINVEKFYSRLHVNPEFKELDKAIRQKRLIKHVNNRNRPVHRVGKRSWADALNKGYGNTGVRRTTTSSKVPRSRKEASEPA